MVKKNNHSRDPLFNEYRQLKRICISVETLLRIKLGLERSTLEDPLPVSEAEVISHLETIANRNQDTGALSR